MKRLDSIATCLVLSFFIFSTEAQYFPWLIPLPQGPYIPQFPPQIFDPQHIPQEPQYPFEPEEPQYPFHPQEPQYPFKPEEPQYPFHPQEPQYPFEPEEPQNPFKPQIHKSDCSKCVCGVNKRSRIVGGTVTDDSNYPWMVRLLVMIENEKKTVCGASLISSKYILTAAHCTLRKTPREFYVRLADKSEHRVRRIISHEYFSMGTMDNDIALMELQSPVKLGDAVNTVCLPKSGTDYHNYIGKNVTVIGYGKLSDRDIISEKPLSKVDVPIISLKECRDRSYYASRGVILTDNMICAGYMNGGKDSCQGDSGGPMFVKGDKGESIQPGVVSFGKNCANPGFPGIYTNVGNYHDWITRHMHGDCLCPSP